jgi:FkbM family methyltransferase
MTPTVQVRTAAQKTIRTILPYIPSRGLADYKADLQRWYRRRLQKPFEEDFRALPLLVPRGSHCLDVGANRGQSIDAMKWAGMDYRITAFEPQVALREVLSRRYRYDPMVTVRGESVGAERRMGTIYIPSYNGYRFDGLASLDIDEAREWLRTRLYFFREERLRIECEQTAVIRLDDLDLSPVGFIKMDIQGGEYDAVSGALNLIQRDRPVLLIESPTPELVSLLADLGYALHTWADGRLVPGGSPCPNAFFLPTP